MRYRIVLEVQGTTSSFEQIFAYTKEMLEEIWKRDMTSPRYELKEIKELGEKPS